MRNWFSRKDAKAPSEGVGQGDLRSSKSRSSRRETAQSTGGEVSGVTTAATVFGRVRKGVVGTSFVLLAILPLGIFASDSIEPPITQENRDHWSFQPLVRPELPSVSDEAAVRNHVDRFILARLEAKGLSLMPEADRPTLLRRLSFDLTGLPPTPEEIAAFVNDDSPRAYDQVVDRLLASPQYGERWGQHWLDLARYAESDGFEHDKVRKNAWRYRDWVIEALNQDVPFNEFVSLQIAGDELRPGDDWAATATGFLLSGPDMPDLNENSERRHLALNEITSTVSSAILGLTMGCAQCHDHKFDPLSQADFYRLRAFFENYDFPAKNKQLTHQFAEQGSKGTATHLMIRGDYRRQGAELSPDFIRVVNRIGAKPSPDPLEKSTGYRTELAEWLTREDHPLTLRVIANRLWMHHFNRPLVGTPNDFGTQGETPTHPELLDWLATELPRQGWSLKSMHRLLVTSATYRQASHGPGLEKAIDSDPENRLLSRMNRRRLSGEALRDAMLLISGELNPKAGGESFRPPLPAEVTVTLLKNQWPVTEDVTEHQRRSIYLFARRNLRYPMFDVFDRPDALASCSRRNVSTTAPQSLTLFNSTFSLERAQAAATLIGEQAGDAAEARVSLAYQRTLNRAPSADERAAATEFLKSQPGDESLTDLCLALFNLNEFVYVD